MYSQMKLQETVVKILSSLFRQEKYVVTIE